MWTITYHLLRKASMEYKKSQEANEKPNNDVEADQRALLLDQLALNEAQEQQYDWTLKELMAPPTIGAILGLIFGTVPWFHHLIAGDHAWLRVIPDCAKLLGQGTIPCITLIMGGNLREGFRSGKLEKSVILGVIAIKYVLLPLIGLGVVSVADKLGFLPPDPLYHFILMVQFTLPPAMNIGTMTELFDVGQKECAVLFLWTYVGAAFALTIWCTIYMLILS